MRKTKIVSTLIAFLLGLAFSAQNGFSANSPKENEPSAPESLASRTITLDAVVRKASFAGLELFLLEDYGGPLPVVLRADCFGRSKTPGFAIDAATFGENARLLNLTKLPEHECASYLVAQGPTTPPPAGNPAPSGIGVSVHYGAPPPAEGQLRDPAVFVFNPVQGNWTEAKSFTPSTPQPQRAYATLAEQQQRIIGGVIAIPESSQEQPARNDPSSIAKPLERISPTDGYLAIDRIEPDSKGAYSVNLPLLLRPSRGPGPSFSIQYSSHGAPGVLGRGWDLHVGTIEVRGPSPLYHSAYETEDYVLDGMDLIALDGDGKDIAPLYKGGPILARVRDIRFFRLRNNSGGLIVRRFGANPGEYFWEVWDPNSHVTKLYGGEFENNGTPPRPSEGTSPGSAPKFIKGTVASGAGAIGQWGLTQEFDSQTGRNGARYFYDQDAAEKRGCSDPSWNGSDCRSALRLSRVDYNLAFDPKQTIDASGVTRVEFFWDKRKPNRFNSDGRLGFFRAQEYWLTELTVIYPKAPDNSLFRTVSLNDPVLPAEDQNGYVLFAKHRFKLSDENDRCMNFDRVLSTYEVEANSRYDIGSEKPLEKQVFSFSYEGRRSSSADCSRDWTGGQITNLGNLPAKAVDGNIGFPAGLLSDLGKDLLVGRSLLGTGRTEETGASMYVGIGVGEDTNSKDTTIGIKGGLNFSKSEGNSTLVDVTGDGIEDIVFRDGGVLKYCAGQRQSDGVHSIVYPDGRCGMIDGISEFSLSSTSTFSVGVETYPGFTTFAGIGINNSTTNTYIYFTDRDGDGLIDLVAYGQVFYGQGEDVTRRVVSFSTKSALTPPIPGNVAGKRLSERFAPELRNTIKDIEARLEVISQRLQSLRYTQTTIAWEAPLDGAITIDASFSTGVSTRTGDDAGPLTDFTPEEFQRLFQRVKDYQEKYIDPRYLSGNDPSDPNGCNIWADSNYCHEVVSDPFGPHYAPSKAHIAFLPTPNPKVQVARSRRYQTVTLCLADTDFDAAGKFDLGGKQFDSKCREKKTASGTQTNPVGTQIEVEAGDVIYLTYSVHPLFNKWLKPEKLKVTYAQVDGDRAFNLRKSGGNTEQLKTLGCDWKLPDQNAPTGSNDCLLSKQERYSFDLVTGTLTTSPTSITQLPAGTERTFGGRFEIPTDITRDYQVYFEVLGAAAPVTDQPITDPSRPPEASFKTIPAATLKSLFRQDISDACKTAAEICTVDIKRPCDGDLATECGFTGSYYLASRLIVQHRIKEALPVRNISSRLAALKWRIAPQVTSFFAEKDAPPGASKRLITVYLPIGMGEPDLEYLRVREGRFANPDTSLTDGGPASPIVDFKDISADEQLNVQVARVRQFVALCGFGREIIDYLRSHYSQSGQPYGDEYVEHWQRKFDAYKSRCADSLAKLDPAKVSLTDGDRFDHVLKNGLRLPAILQDLSYSEQVTSAETLLERVLKNLVFEAEFLTDNARLTRRGYRLPVKANPLDCAMLARIGSDANPPEPVDAAIHGPEGSCAYRISTNFAMQELEDLGVVDPEAKNIRETLARFSKSNERAFKVELTATLNGRPLGFLELTGSQTGNELCEPVTKNTCIGNYGSGTPPGDPVPDYYHPLPRGAGSPRGDVFQRITVNKRIGRAVGFSNNVMNDRTPTDCFRSYPDYKVLGEIELKQDCLYAKSDITPDQKYTAKEEAYRIEYGIGENNQFDGRNRVLEFKARPLDIVEFHYRIAGVQNTVIRMPGVPGDTIVGKFSIFDAKNNDPANPPMGLKAGRHVIPRSPSQILPGGDVNLKCNQPPPLPGPGVIGQTRDRTGNAQLPARCRPWTSLAWTEMLLGAQYRTYSDAEKVLPGQPTNTYSIRRRREILRLQPEIEVEADSYVLEHRAAELPMVEDSKPDQLRQWFDRNDPNVTKTGGDWLLFAGKTKSDGDVKVLDDLKTPPVFFATPFSSGQSLRFGRQIVPADPGSKPDYGDISNACGTPDKPQYENCSDKLGTRGDQALSLNGFDFFPLVHRFVGPPNAEVAARLRGDSAVRPKTGQCAAEYPTGVASCWKGIDDTVFLESAIEDKAGADQARYSVSALRGLERPPLAHFRFEFASATKLGCLDPEAKFGSCPALVNPAMVAAGPPSAGNDPLLPAPLPTPPNRPMPPQPARAIEVFAPVQTSEARAMSMNAGFAYFNTDSSSTTRRSTRIFQDVNGDGFPDVVSDGIVQLTSPVGLTRSDWWNYYRAKENVPSPDFQPQANNYEPSAKSSSQGAGIGLSPSTFAQVQRTKTTGSPDASVDPSFSLSLERGQDDEFIELRDFNGDGLPDRIRGSTGDQGLELNFNTGNALRGGRVVAGSGLSPFHYNTTHSAGFGVRLGFSWGAGSFVAGAGLSHRDGGSQAALIDMTGDGRPDIVLPGNEEGTLVVFPNLGNGFDPNFSRTHRLTNWNWKFRNGLNGESGTQLSETTLVDAGAGYTFGFSVWFLKIVFSPDIKWARNQTRELLNIRDINGDGMPDVVAVSGEFVGPSGAGGAETQVRYNPDGKYHLLAGIKNPSGSEWVLRHGLYGNSGPEHGRPVWALTAAARYDGYEPKKVPSKVALPADGQDVLLTTHDYSGGYYNRAERQFYGFATRTSTAFGCDVGTEGPTGCLALIRGEAELTPASLRATGYVELQRIDATFANRDFLTQGLELTKTVSGVRSLPVPTNGPEQVVSRNIYGYSVDDLASLTNSDGQCKLQQGQSGDSWTVGYYSIDKSRLASAWDGRSRYGNNGKLFGNGSLCGTNVQSCVHVLSDKVCAQGFIREQAAFWAQQSGSIRQRLTTQETFGDVPNADSSSLGSAAIPRLRSAVGFDHDQWGQVLTLNSIGEARPSWDPLEDSAANAKVTYTRQQGLNALRGQPDCTYPSPKDSSKLLPCGYPMLGLADAIRIFAGSVKGDDAQPLRAREAIYPEDGRGNLSDVCAYPGGHGFTFPRDPDNDNDPRTNLCKAFRDSMKNAVSDGYSTMQTALRKAYDDIPGLPKGVAEFNAIIHHQMVSYDDFGNLAHGVSPLSHNKEWIERRYSYAKDPFRRTAASMKLTRCVSPTAGAGTDTPGFEQDLEGKCTYGLATLPEPVRRKSITHASQLRIDSHFGAVAEKRDINTNSMLYDFDRWGRLRLVARSWGNQPRENVTFRDQLQLALKKTDRPTFTPETAVKDWRILALADYGITPEGLLRSNVRRFESAPNYAGLLAGDNTTRETALLSDGLGQPVQSIREADVCLGIKPDFIDKNANEAPSADLQARCSDIATGIVTPSTAIDALGRDLQSFEPYTIAAGPTNRTNSDLRFKDLLQVPALNPAQPPTGPPGFLTQTTYDGAGRPVLVESRLTDDITKPGSVKGSTQHRYRVRQDAADQPGRFEAVTLSPRCTASAVWSDARGLKRTVLENQQTFYPRDAGDAPLKLGVPPLKSGTTATPYQRDYAMTRGYCSPVDGVEITDQWAQVSYGYDPLQQLTAVDSPLDGTRRSIISVQFDQMGRTLELNEPDGGCTRYAYDGLNLLISQAGFGFERNRENGCGGSTKVRNEKTYTYSGGRLLEMAYRSLEEQAGVPDRLDTVHFYHDRYPQATRFGETHEALRFLPNDEANQRFIEITNRKCDNCIGQVTIVDDRSGARAFSYNELGLPIRETRSIVAPLTDLKLNNGKSETYLPEVAFYELENSYTGYGDPLKQTFTERAPTNPANGCINVGVTPCLANFTIGRKYGPDGALAQLLFNDDPLINAAQDALGRPAVRWTANGLATGYRYDPKDMRLNQMATLTAAKRTVNTVPTTVPVQVNGYQYDGGGNIVSYANRAVPVEAYESNFEFAYDAVNRLTGFSAAVAKGTQGLLSDGTYEFDAGHRFAGRKLSIRGGTVAGGKINPAATSFDRDWRYRYELDPAQKGPRHAPKSIVFTLGNNPENGRGALLQYDDLGRMTGVRADKEDRLGLLSNRAMTWDAEGRLLRVRGVADSAVPDNTRLLQEDYVYDSGGNRAIKIDHPRVKLENGKEQTLETATIYMTPFYARPYNKRGTVQLSQGSLPTVTLTPPADTGESPVATYLYSDLPVGSMTSAVTVFSEPDNADGIIVARREYDPFGLELTSDDLAKIGRETVAPMSVFHGKELDRVTNLSSFGARYYSRDMGIWLKPDPMLASYLAGVPYGGVFGPPNLSSYAYAHQRPTSANDPDGQFLNVLGGAAVGAVLGGGVELGRQLYVDHGISSWNRVGAAAAGGAVSGAIAGASFGGSLVIQVGIAGLSSAAGATTTRALLGEKTTAADAAQDALVGILTLGLVKGGGAAIQALKGIKTLDASRIHFSQSSVNEVGEIAASMRLKGWVGAPVDVVATDLGLVAVDNTRVLAAHLSETPVKAIVRGANELLPASMKGRFVSAAGVEARTWGEAIATRIGKQSAGYRNLFESGSWFVGVNKP